MATASDHTSFRTYTEDGMLDSEYPSKSNGFDINDFEMYAYKHEREGIIAQWYVVNSGEVIAESSEAAGLVTYPAASLFS